MNAPYFKYAIAIAIILMIIIAITPLPKYVMTNHPPFVIRPIQSHFERFQDPEDEGTDEDVENGEEGGDNNNEEDTGRGGRRDRGDMGSSSSPVIIETRDPVEKTLSESKEMASIDIDIDEGDIRESSSVRPRRSREGFVGGAFLTSPISGYYGPDATGTLKLVGSIPRHRLYGKRRPRMDADVDGGVGRRVSVV